MTRQLGTADAESAGSAAGSGNSGSGGGNARAVVAGGAGAAAEAAGSQSGGDCANPAARVGRQGSGIVGVRGGSPGDRRRDTGSAAEGTQRPVPKAISASALGAESGAGGSNSADRPKESARLKKPGTGSSARLIAATGAASRARVPGVAEMFGRPGTTREPGAIRAEAARTATPDPSAPSAPAPSDPATTPTSSNVADTSRGTTIRKTTRTANRGPNSTAPASASTSAASATDSANPASATDGADPTSAAGGPGPASTALGSVTSHAAPSAPTSRRSSSARLDEEQEPRWLVDRFVGFQFAEERFLPGQDPDGPYSSPDQAGPGMFPGSDPGALTDQVGRRPGMSDASGFSRESLLSGRFSEPLTGPDQQPGTARLATPGAVAAAVPFFFGFHPSSSVVILGLLRSGHSPRAAISQGLRVDLDRIQRNPAGFGRWLARRLAADGVTEVLGLLYPPEPGPARLGDYRRMIAGLCAPLRQAGIATLDVLMVARSRWWSFLCENPQCCPPDGSPIDFSGSPVAALSAYTGLAIMPSREALAQALAPHDSKVRQETEQECRRAVRRFPELKPRSTSRDRVVLSWAGVMRAWAAADEIALRVTEDAIPVAEALTGELAGQLLAALPDVRVRDYLAGWCGGPRAGLCLDLAIELARRAVNDRQAAAGYSVGAWAAWAVGWGAWSRLCLDRAMAAMPEYSLAVLIEQGLERGVDPGMVRNAATGTAMQLADMVNDPET